MPLTVAECGIDRAEYEKMIPEMANIAFGDQCTISNPRMPLVTELETLFKKAYGPAAPAAKTAAK